MIDVAIPSKRKRFSLPEVLNDDERQRLLKQPNRRYRSGLRNHCMMRLMINLGLRCSEVLNIELRDVDLTSGKLLVRQGKGSKDRLLWIGADDLALIQKWRERRPENATTLFCTLQGKRINSRYVRTMVARYAKKAGIERRVHPHLLRHSFASDLYRQSRDIRLIQRVLGHASISTSQIYVHLGDSEVEQALKTFRHGNGATRT